MRSAVLTLLLALPATSLAGLNGLPMPLATGEHQRIDLDSPHPYVGGSSQQPAITTREIVHAGATSMQVHFSDFQLAPGDEVVVRDRDSLAVHRYTDGGRNQGRPFWAFAVPGDVVLIEIQSSSRTGAYGFTVDTYVHGFAPFLPESICSADDKENVLCYETSHPTHYDRARAVAKVEGPGFVCTGFLVSCDDHFLTNDHCWNGDISGYQMRFDFESPCSGGNGGAVRFPVVEDVRSNGSLDYWLSRLGGTPSTQFPFLVLDGRALVADEEIYIPQHPGGSSKKFGIDSDSNNGGVCRIDDPNFRGVDTGYLCDTAGGSSGSPVLSPSNHEVVAIHHTGGCLNGGVRMDGIVPQVDGFIPTLASPLNFAVSDTGSNQVDLTWDDVAGATSYRVRRVIGTCNGALTAFATTPVSMLSDTTVSGGTSYAYVVQAESPPGCPSSCIDLVATGECILPPTFAGVQAVANPFAGGCELEVRWSGGVGQCSSDLVYNVYRDTSPGFVPGAGNRIASCLTGTSVVDTGVTSGTRYYYVVRAEDRMSFGSSGPCGGVEETNGIEITSTPVADTSLGQIVDGAEMAPSVLTLEAPWALSTVDAMVGTGSFRIQGDVAFTCASLVTPTFVATAGTTLSYGHREENQEIEWDGGTVELSANGGTTWTRLEPTPPYNSVFLPQSNSCNNDGLGGGMYSGDSAGAWATGSIDLSAYAGQEVALRFRFATDDAQASDGWWIDEVAVSDIAIGSCSGGVAWKLYRSTVASLTVGWQSTVPLPITPTSNRDIGWPVDVLAPFTHGDSDALLDADPLMVYRLLDDNGGPVGNQLRLVKSGANDIAIAY